MQKIIMTVAYIVSFIPLITGSYFDIYYLMTIMLLVTFLENIKEYDFKKMRNVIILGSSSVMIYTILMGRSDMIIMDYLIFVFGIHIFGKIVEESKKERGKTNGNKFEKYFMPSISQLAIFLIIMLVMQEITAITIYILISYIIVYVFSKNINSLVEMIYFIFTQVTIAIMVFSFVQEVDMTEMFIYIMIIINASISGFYGKIKNKIK